MAACRNQVIPDNCYKIPFPILSIQWTSFTSHSGSLIFQYGRVATEYDTRSITTIPQKNPHVLLALLHFGDASDAWKYPPPRRRYIPWLMRLEWILFAEEWTPSSSHHSIFVYRELLCLYCLNICVLDMLPKQSFKYHSNNIYLCLYMGIFNDSLAFWSLVVLSLDVPNIIVWIIRIKRDLGDELKMKCPRTF